MSRAFNDWYLTERDQRAYLKIGLRWATETYDRLWEEAGAEPGDPDGPDQVDSFEEKVHGLWPHDFEWMHQAAVLRDAVTGFEVYLEKAYEEVLKAHGYAPTRSPRWGDLCDFYKLLGVVIDAQDIRAVRDLRHFLTHQRGELRTEGQRKQFAPRQAGQLPEIVVQLGEAEVNARMDVLAAAVRSIDPAVYTHTWGGRRMTQQQLASLR